MSKYYLRTLIDGKERKYRLMNNNQKMNLITSETILKGISSEQNTFIDTGIKANSVTRVRARVSIFDSSNSVLIGSAKSGLLRESRVNEKTFCKVIDNKLMYSCGNDVEVPYNIELNKSFTVDVMFRGDTQIFGIDGQQLSKTTIVDYGLNDRNMYIYSLNSIDGISGNPGFNVEYLQMYYNGSMIRYFVPIDIDGKKCFVDTITNTIFNFQNA